MRMAGLFSGGGGFEYAATLMGWDVAFTCEIDSFCQRILKYYFKNAEHYGDIKKTDFRKYRGKIDVLTGGFPCQPFSVAGSRKGKEDHRYLWPEMLRAIREIRPYWVIGENVAGITSMVQPGCETPVENQASLFEESDTETILEQEFVIETISEDLEREGYSVQPFNIPACSIGAPHKRERVWFIANNTNARVKSLQQEGKDGIYRSEIITYANSHDAGRCGYGETGCKTGESKTEQEECERFWSLSQRISEEGSSSDSPGEGLQERIKSNGRKDTEKDRSGLDNRFKRSCSNENVTYSDKLNGDLSRFRASKLSQFKTPGVWENYWENFPSQSPVCSRDDGFSDLLDFDALFEASGAKERRRKRFGHYNYWRSESVKLFGNAIVSQVAIEFFKVIEKIEREMI